MKWVIQAVLVLGLRITTMTPMQSEESTPGHNDESTPA
jgi:hypothetical protein